SVSSSWLIACKDLDIKNGQFAIDTGLSSTNNSMATWLPIKKINTTVKDAVFGPNKIGCNLDQLTCSLNENLILHSCNALVCSDSLLRVKITLGLVASIVNKELSISKTDTFEFTTIISGSPEKLLIEQLGVSTNSGTRLELTGSV